MLSIYSRRNNKQIRVSRTGKKFQGVTIFCALLGVVVGSASLNGQQTGFRLLPKINLETAVDRGAKLITINEERSLPPMVLPSKARIITPVHTKVAQVIAPPQPVPVIVGTEDNALEHINSTNRETGRYVVSFSKPLPTLTTQDKVKTANDVELPDLTDPATPVKEEIEKVDLKPSSAGDDSAAADEEMTELNDMLDDIKRKEEADDPDNESDQEDDLDQEDDSDSGGDDLEDLDDDESPRRQELGEWPSRSIQEVRVDASEYESKVPEDRSANLFANSKRFGVDLGATDKTFAFAAPNIRYQPLYFEDVSLERYGQTRGLIKQPFASAVKFFGGRAVLPLRALRDNPYSCDSPLGYCRPGSANNGECGCETGTCESCDR